MVRGGIDVTGKDIKGKGRYNFPPNNRKQKKVPKWKHLKFMYTTNILF